MRQIALRHLAMLTNSNVDKLTNPREIPVRLCNYVDVYKNDRITNNISFMNASATPTEISRFGLRVGDVLITKDSEDRNDIAVPAYVAEAPDDLVCGYHLSLLRSRPSIMSGAFLFWALQSKQAREAFSNAAGGVTRFGLTLDGMKSVELPCPDSETQKAIANFLDRETARIDQLIDKKRRLLDVLTEHLSAQLRRLLDEDTNHYGSQASRKLPWLGQIPKTWHELPLKLTSQVIDCKHTTPTYIDSGSPLISTGEVRPFKIHFSSNRMVDDKEFFVMRAGGRDPRPSDIIYSRNASVGSAARVGNLPQFCMGQDICLIRPNRINSRYLEYVLNSFIVLEQLNSLLVGSTLKRINVANIQNFVLLVPSAAKQEKIVQTLDAARERNRTLCEQVSASIDLLTEFRAAMITAAVTGQIDVATWGNQGHTDRRLDQIEAETSVREARA